MPTDKYKSPCHANKGVLIVRA